MKTVCGAKTRSGGICQKPPMEGANRCRLHGGATPKGTDSPHFKTGEYADAMKRQIASKFAATRENPLDLVQVLNLQYNLLDDYLGRFQVGMAMTAGDIQMLYQWSSEIGKTVERIVRIKNESALTKAEVAYLAARISDVVSQYISNPEQQREFVHSVFGGLGDSSPHKLSS